MNEATRRHNLANNIGKGGGGGKTALRLGYFYCRGGQLERGGGGVYSGI